MIKLIKRLFGTDKVVKRPWPTREVDYDGNQMWRNSFPQSRELSQSEINYYKSFMPMITQDWANYYQKTGQVGFYGPYQSGSLLGGLLKPFGI